RPRTRARAVTDPGPEEGGDPQLWSVTLDRPFLVVRFPQLHEVASWAVVGGGRRQTRTVAWLEVRNADLAPGVDAITLADRRLQERGLGEAVGLLTSRRIDRHHEHHAICGDVKARALATVGLSNALRVGDSPGPLRVGLHPDAPGYGTINVLAAVSEPLSEEAAWEAMSIAAEARTAAVMEAGFPSRRSGAIATGTGTDCLVVAWPSRAPESRAAPAAFAGKHTALGHVIGETVFHAVRAGVAAWLAENQPGGTP
ncbi:MAG TPA: adenosylcobinamide amidohydrolase, partial [Polyangia bacterium]